MAAGAFFEGGLSLGTPLIVVPWRPSQPLIVPSHQRQNALANRKIREDHDITTGRRFTFRSPLPFSSRLSRNTQLGFRAAPCLATLRCANCAIVQRVRSADQEQNNEPTGPLQALGPRSGVAACGSCAAKVAAGRSTDGIYRQRPGSTGPPSGISGGPSEARMDRGPQHLNRSSLGRL